MSFPTTMRAQVLTGHGGTEMLDYREDWPVPVPGPSDVLVHVSACGVNNTDVNTRVGWYAGGGWSGALDFPRIQGADPIGSISGVGSEVDRRRVGERVIVDPWIRGDTLSEARYLGSEVDGGFADYVVVPASNARPIESDLTDVDLATFACSYSTAENMLVRSELSAGQWVMISGASGGVGTALVQLARIRDARVLALTSALKVDAVSAIGADVVLDRDTPQLATRVTDVTGGVDVFADVVAGPAFASLLDTIRRGGHYVVAGAVAGHRVELDLRTLYLHDMTMHGVTMVPETVFTGLLGHIESGNLRPLVDRTFGLEDLPEAQDHFLRRGHLGAIVIDMGH